MKLVSFRGVYPKKKKATAGVELVQMRPIEFYNVSLKMPNLPESEPCVNVGSTVKQGTLIAKPAGKVGLNLFSPVSGKVLNIFSKMNSAGEYSKHILIMNDNKNEIEDLPETDSISDIVLIERLRDAGIVDTISGMPSYLKYSYIGARSYRTLLILLDSTDPNNTVNQTITEFKMEEVVNGARYFMNITSATSVTFVFTEANYHLASKLKKHIEENKKNYDYKIKFIPNKYPFDNPYILANLVCNKKISEKTSFLEAGISIESAEACYNFCRAVEFNKPVTTKIITVDGSNIQRKGNYIVQNGVSYDNILEFRLPQKSGGYKSQSPTLYVAGKFHPSFAPDRQSNHPDYNLYGNCQSRTVPTACHTPRSHPWLVRYSKPAQKPWPLLYIPPFPYNGNSRPVIYCLKARHWKPYHYPSGGYKKIGSHHYMMPDANLS